MMETPRWLSRAGKSPRLFTALVLVILEILVLLDMVMCVCVSVYPDNFGSFWSPGCWCCMLLQESLQSYGSQREGKSEKNSPSPPQTAANRYTGTCFMQIKPQHCTFVHVQTLSAYSLYHSFSITRIIFNSIITDSAGSHCCSFSLVFTRESCSPSSSWKSHSSLGPTVGLNWGIFLVFLSNLPQCRSLFCKWVWLICSVPVISLLTFSLVLRIWNFIYSLILLSLLVITLSLSGTNRDDLKQTGHPPTPTSPRANSVPLLPPQS